MRWASTSFAVQLSSGTTAVESVGASCCASTYSSSVRAERMPSRNRALLTPSLRPHRPGSYAPDPAMRDGVEDPRHRARLVRVTGTLLVECAVAEEDAGRDAEHRRRRRLHEPTSVGRETRDRLPIATREREIRRVDLGVRAKVRAGLPAHGPETLGARRELGQHAATERDERAAA